MIATGFAQNGAQVYIASRKEKQLQEVCAFRILQMTGAHNTVQAVADIKKVAAGKVEYIVANVAVRYILPSVLVPYLAHQYL